MRDPQNLARPYAKAIFEFAKETQELESWSRVLNFLSMVAENKRVSDFLSNPEVSKTKMAEFFIEAAGRRLNEYGHNFISALAQYRRLILLPQIKKLFEEMLEREQKTLSMEFITADHLSKEKQKELEEALSKKLHKKIKLEVTEDKSVLAGFLLKSGSFVLDASIAGQLNNLKNMMNGG